MKRKKHIWVVPAILVSFVVIMLLWYYLVSLRLSVSCYEVEAQILNSIQIVQLTDLHNAEFGENNSELVGRVKEQKPDLILMTGDMINRDDEDIGTITNLISGFAEIAPVYYGFGNHETVWENNWNRSLHDELTKAGATVLDCEYVDVNVKGNDLRIGGYMGYYWQPHMMTQDEEQQELEYAFFSDFQRTSRYKILLNHIPTQWVDWHYVDKCPVDLVFCGHYHGGVFRLPLLDQGLYAPYVGWFPPFTKGIYEGEKATCVLSAGLGSEYIVPRLNNPPEIVVVDLIPKA